MMRTELARGTPSTNAPAAQADPAQTGMVAGWMRAALPLILILALALRLIYGLAQDPLAPYTRGVGDSAWYLVNGDALITGRQAEDIPVDLAKLPTPPGYLVLLGVAQAIFSPGAAVVALRVVQALMSTAICWCGWRLALRLTGRSAAGLLAALLFAIAPAFIIEAAQIASETLYMTLIAFGLAAYVEFVYREDWREDSHPYGGSRIGLLAVSAICFGVAGLTRAPILLFPVGLALHLLIVYGRRAFGRAFGRALRWALLLLLVYAAVLSTWTIYSAARWGRIVVGGQGFASFIYLGATGWDGPEAVDERLGSTQGGASDQTYIETASASISADPLGYIRRRIGELGGAYLQPHGTAYFPGESLKDLALNWLRDDRTLSGLAALTQGDAFVPKALLYVFHYGALLLGVIGMLRARGNWRTALVLLGFIGYTTLVHLFLLALPRYIFPTMIAWIVFTAAAMFPPRKRAGEPIKGA